MPDHVDAALGRDGGGLGTDGVVKLVDDAAVGVAQVEADTRLAGNDVAGGGFHRNLADGGDGVLDIPGERFDGEDDLGGGGQRVVAVGHGDGAGVSGGAGDVEVGALGANDAGDDPDRDAGGFEAGALLDVGLDEPMYSCSGARPPAHRSVRTPTPRSHRGR